MTEKKMTKRDFFEQIKANYDLTDAELAFIDHEIELLSNKNKGKNGERKQTKVQIENEKLKSAILSEMGDGVYYTISDMLKNIECCAELTNQKVNAMMTQLRRENLVVRTEDKGRAYFSKVN